MVQPSRVFPKRHREFRSYVRLRLTLVRKRTDIKNEAHAILTSEMFNLRDVLADIFGKNGMAILAGISSGKSVGELGAAILIAEIGNFKDFSSEDKLASWLGIVPNVYQSSDKYQRKNHKERIKSSKVDSGTVCSSSIKKEKQQAKRVL